VTNLSSKVEDYDFKNGLLLRTVEIQQTKTSKMSELIEELQGKNLVLERSLAKATEVAAVEPEVNGLKESFMAILDSCENFQENFNSMEEKQGQMNEKLESMEENLNTAKLENSELRDEMAKMGGKFSSLSLEFQVDKGQSKVQMDNLAYNLALLESKIPSETFSSTSGVKSAELSDTEEGKETSNSSSSSSLTKLTSNKKLVPASLQTIPQPSSPSFPFLVNECPTASQPRLPLMPRIPTQAQYFQFVPSQTAAYPLYTPFYR